MQKEVNLTLEKVLSLGGKVLDVNELGKTQSKKINKLIKENLFSVKPNDKLIYLTYSNCSQIQAIFKQTKEKNNLIQVFSALE